MSKDALDVDAARALDPEDLAALIHSTERDQLAHGPDPYTGVCQVCRRLGPCDRFTALSTRLGLLRNIRDTATVHIAIQETP